MSMGVHAASRRWERLRQHRPGGLLAGRPGHQPVRRGRWGTDRCGPARPRGVCRGRHRGDRGRGHRMRRRWRHRPGRCAATADWRPAAARRLARGNLDRPARGGRRTATHLDRAPPHDLACVGMSAMPA